MSKNINIIIKYSIFCVFVIYINFDGVLTFYSYIFPESVSDDKYAADSSNLSENQLPYIL